MESARSLGTQVVAAEFSRILARKSDHLIAGGTLRNPDPLLVEPALELTVTPRVEKFAAEVVVGVGSD